MSGLCRVCRGARGLETFLCRRCRDVIGEEKHAELLELEFRLRSGRNVPKPDEYRRAFDDARRSVGR
jgi:hypothetical protein